MWSGERDNWHIDNAGSPMNHDTFDVAVLGGGIWGLSTAYHLRRLGVERVVVLEQFEWGHRRASSHGASRITRSTYPDPLYVTLMAIAHGEDWPRLEVDAGRRLIHNIPGCFFGPTGGTVDDYAAAVAAVGADVDPVDPGEALRRFPELRFEPSDSVLIDNTGGLVAARDTLDALHGLLTGVDLRDRWPVTQVTPTSQHIRLVGPRGSVECGRLVITAGAWASRFVPALEQPLRPVRQTLAYFKDTPGFRPGQLPVWAYLGTEESEMMYGLPAYAGEGVKVARYLTDGRDDPDGEVTHSPAEGEHIDQFVAQRLPSLRSVDRRLDTCLFAMAPHDDFIIGALPREPRIVVGTGGSGHGFKFGPLVGRLLAELCDAGVTSVAQFESNRDRFAIHLTM